MKVSTKRGKGLSGKVLFLIWENRRRKANEGLNTDAQQTKVEQRVSHEFGIYRFRISAALDEVMMQILIVEDDAALGLFLQKGLALDGHDVEWIADGEAAQKRLDVRRPDLMILDLSLPKRDGIEILEALAGRFEGMSVMVLTGRNEVSIRVNCLNIGADDCMMKPFSFHEFRARCRALLRRRDQFADPVLRQSGIELHRMERRVTRDGKQIDLTVKEFALLEFLLQRRGRCCSRAELLREVWQMSPDTGTNVVDVYINYLRRKLAAAYPVDEVGDGGPELIETVRGSGYMLRDGTSTVPLGLHRKGIKRAGVADLNNVFQTGVLGVRRSA